MEQTVASIPVGEPLTALIALYKGDAGVDVPELINLTLQALLNGYDYTYPVRLHGCQTDVPQEYLLDIMKRIYDTICRALSSHDLNYVYGLDLINVTYVNIVVGITLTPLITSNIFKVE